ncbi:MAG: hypothetical protein FD149_714 [Rhodospirillaceae bacterium]|nr:MAG: hypothetical protein FD149_714 [Rhodospirillaceae bacterium]
MNSVGLFAPQRHRTARMVATQLETLAPGAAVSFDITFADRPKTGIAAHHLWWEAQDLAALRTAGVFGFRHEEPALASENDEQDWSLWQAEYLLRQQQHSYRVSLFRRLDAVGVRLFNPPGVHERAFAKLSQLLALHRAGLAVPPVTLTNEHEEERALLATRNDLLWRPATGRGSWQRFRERQCLALVQDTQAPVLLAPIVPGRLIRAWVVEGEIVLALGSRWVLLLFVVGEGGEPVFYDVDCDPVLDTLPAVMGEQVAKGWALALLDQREEIARLPPLAEGISCERTTLFHRRMLGILFDIEATKHEPL